MEQSASLPASEKLPIPSRKPAKFAKTHGPLASMNINVMEWNGGNAMYEAAGGPSTTEGSLFEDIGLNVTFHRQDNCNTTMEEIIKNATDMKNGKTDVPLGTLVMGDGVPGFSVTLRKVIDNLGYANRIVVIDFVGRSDGEDGFWGPKEWRKDPTGKHPEWGPQNAIGGTVAGVKLDGDLNIVFIWAAQNHIPVNIRKDVYDPHAFNIIYCTDFIEASNKYVSGFKTDKVKILGEDGNTIPNSDTQVVVMSATTWTPGDVNMALNKGGLVKLASTHDFTTQMPCALLLSRSWATTHRDIVEAMIGAIHQAGDQIRSFPDALENACSIAADIYQDKDKPAEYWMKYYHGVKHDDISDTEIKGEILGGSMAFNLADAACMFGLTGEKVDYYKNTYTTLGEMLYGYYPTMDDDNMGMAGWIHYGDSIVDKSFISDVVENHPELLKGGVLHQVSSGKNIQVSNGNYSIDFANNSAVILSSSNGTIEKIVEYARLGKDLRISIIGHSSSTGDETHNIELSRQRAQSVVDALKNAKVTNNIDFDGVGSKKPIPGTDPKDGKNRRVEISMFN